MTTPEENPEGRDLGQSAENQDEHQLTRLLEIAQSLADQLHPGRPSVTVGPDSRLDIDVGFDSLSFLELRDRLEIEFDMIIPDDAFVEGLTPRDWLRGVHAGLVGKSYEGTSDGGASIAPEEKQSPQQFTRPAGKERPRAIVEHGDEEKHSLPPWTSPGVFTRERARRFFAEQRARIADYIYGAYAYVVALVVVGCCWPFIVMFPISPHWRWRIARVAGTVLVQLVGVRVTVVGGLPTDRPMLVVANHPSVVDGLLLVLGVREPLTFLVGEVFSKQRLIARFLSGLGCVFVKSGTAADAEVVTNQITELLRSGRSIASFPEGGLEETLKLRDFYLGGLRAAAAAGVPVVPIGISGTRSIVAPGTRLPRRGEVCAAIGSPIMATGTDWESLIVLRDQSRSAIAELSGIPA